MKHKTTTRKLKILAVAATAALIGVIIAACFITHAAFTNSLRAQRAIAAYESSRDRFTSNYLMKIEEASEAETTKIIFVTSSEATPTAIISVCNYPQGNRARFLDDDISYTLTVEYVKLDSVTNKHVAVTDSSYITGISATDDDDYDVKILPKNSETELISISASSPSASTSAVQTITGGVADSDLYLLKFGKDFVKEDANLCAKVTATPTNPAYNTLTCIFMPDLRAAGAQTRWTGDLMDKKSDGQGSLLPKDYDGFNYRISGTGSGTVTLIWDTSYLDLSAVQKIEIGNIPGAQITVNGNTASAVFPVDSTVLDVYDFQFYKTGSFDSVSWENLEGIPAVGGNPGTPGIISFSFS